MHQSEIHAVSICQPCLFADSSIAPAAEDAFRKIVNMYGVSVKSKSGISGPTPRIVHMGQNITFETDTSRYETVAARDTIPEKYYIDNMLIVLVGPENETPHVPIRMPG